jgi:hypothetical protein
MKRIAAIVFAVLAVGAMAFQIALAAGAPLGAYAMGGANPGQYPPELRVGAIIQAILQAGMAAIVLARAELIQVSWLHKAARGRIWAVVALCAISLVLNLITPSAGERVLWVPVLSVLLICSLVVALGKTSQQRIE